MGLLGNPFFSEKTILPKSHIFPKNYFVSESLYWRNGLLPIFSVNRSSFSRNPSQGSNYSKTATSSAEADTGSGRSDCRIHSERSVSWDFVNQKELLQFIEDKFSMILTYDQIEGFLKRRACEFSRMRLVPQALTQMQVTSFDSYLYTVLIKIYFPHVPAEWIFNMDMSSLSD
jgi:hypothetical protein